MATKLEKLIHQRDQAVQNHAERKQKRATDLSKVKAQAASTVQDATDRAERDQMNEDLGHKELLSILDELIAEAA
jgi:hypothetical protein